MREVIFWVQRSHVTSAIPTFCLVYQDGALCWRNCKGPGQGGASDFRLYGASVLLSDRNVNTAAMHWGETQSRSSWTGYGVFFFVFVCLCSHHCVCRHYFDIFCFTSCFHSWVQLTVSTLSCHGIVYIWYSPSCLFVWRLWWESLNIMQLFSFIHRNS